MLTSEPESSHFLYKVGVVGAGGIVKSAHLPAYQRAGFRVQAVCDFIYDRAMLLARDFNIPKAYGSLEELLEDPSIDIIDVAVPPEVQLPIALKAIQRGKHLLCQKPLARSVTEAEAIVNAAEASGIKLAVNVSMRWGPANRAIKSALQSGVIGEIESILFDVKYFEVWGMWPWLMRSDRLVVLFDMIHLLDFTRFLMGEPLKVRAQYGRSPNSPVSGETWADVTLEYGKGVFVRYVEDSQVPLESTSARYTVTGSKGTLTGQFGIYYDLPVGRPDTLKVVSKGSDDSTIPERELPGRWVPDAFSETMRELMRSIEANAEPQNSGRDHIKTLKLIESIYSVQGK